MCCFAQPVVSVSDTQLFARMADSEWQYLIYQMKFESETLNAMILPLPVAKQAQEDDAEFISLKEYDDIFEDLDKGFPYIAPARSRSLGVDSAAGQANLAVHDVGDFVASFVPSLDDFSRLDPRFVIPRESWDKIPHYADYGFAVFQLKELKGKPHPMAFKFKTRHEDQLFFPTVHIHDGEVHKREHFDHMLYLQHAKFDEAVGKYVNNHSKDRATGFVRSRLPAKSFCKIDKTADMIDPELLVHRISLKGQLENKDFVVDLARNFDQAKRRSNLVYSIPLLTVAAGVAGMGWLFNRRTKLQAEKLTDPNKAAK